MFMKISNLETALEGFQEFLDMNGVNIFTQDLLVDYSKEFIELDVEIDCGQDLLDQLECNSTDPPGWFVEFALNYEEEPVEFYRMLRDDEVEASRPEKLAASLALLFLQCWLEHKVWLLHCGRC